MSSVSEVTRMSGLMSGLDTESLVKAATANTKNAINARKQKLQSLQWKQEAYRGVIKSLTDFQSKYLDILSKDSIRSNAVMKANKAVSSNEALSVSAGTSAVHGKYSITEVQTAKAAKIEGIKASSGGIALDFSGSVGKDNAVKVTLDGATREIKYNGGASADEAKANFLDTLNKEFDGITAAEFSFNGNRLEIVNAADDKVSHIFSVGYSSSVGLKNDASNMISSSAKIGSLDFAQGLTGNSFEFSINGESFKFDKETTIKDMINEVNRSDAGVKMSFSGLTQSFTMETTATGAGQEIEIFQAKGTLINAIFNLDSDEISTAPTTASLANKTIDNDVKFQFTADAAGFADGDNIIINGKVMSVTGLTRKQDSEKITVDGSEVTSSLFTDADGNTVNKYVKDGITHYAKKQDDGTYKDVMTVENNKVYVDGSEVEGVTADEKLAELGIEKKYKEISAADYTTALNNAYKASFPEGKGTFSVTVADGSANITFDPEDDVNTAAAVTGNITVEDTGFGSDGIVTNYDSSPYAVDTVVAGKGEMSMVVNGTDIVKITGTGADGGITIKDLTDSGYFTYDESTGELAVAGKNKIAIAPESSMETLVAMKDMFGTLDLVGKDNVGTKRIHGSNAQITVNGVTLESASNVFSIDGTTFGIENVKEFTADDVANGDAEEITVDISKDTSKIKETILNFVEEYNKLLDTMNEQLSTSRPKSDGDYYDPLTEEQEDEMEPEEIEKWNEQAKKGLLYHDTTLSKVFTNIRSAINASAGGMTIQALGIDTSDDYTEYGKLVIDDESALDAAIERYGDEIADFFTDTKNGLGAALNNAVKAAVDTSTNANGYPKGTLTSMAGVENTRSDKKNLIYSQIESVQSIIDRLNERYESQQERLWKQYSSLETYINQMNSQSSSLFGTGTTA